jgi:hypothetical protein
MHLGGNKKQVIHSQATSVSHGHLMGFTAHQGLQIQRYTFLTLDITVVNLHRLWMLIKRGCSRQPGTLICHCSCLSPLISLLACIEFLSNAGRVSTSHKVLEPIESSSKSLINLEKLLILFYGLLGIRMLWFLFQEPLVVSGILIRSHNISHHQLDGSNIERNIPEQNWSLEVEQRGMA